MIDGCKVLPVTDMPPQSVYCGDYALWKAQCSAGRLPRWKHDLELLDFPVGRIPYMMLVQIDPADGLGFYRFWGTKVTNSAQGDMTGKRLSEIGGTPPGTATVEQQYAVILETQKPHIFVYEFEVELSLGLQKKHYEASLRMPFSDDGQSVDWVLSIDHYAESLDQLMADIEGRQ